ncbi:MAG: SurA N-terminal domain-containing protein [Woeseiaceae bacterium]|nr:SurA N-terminal domain-containing protein [Woeseiaceae bacterium]
MKNIRYLTIIIACLPSLSGTATAALSETGEMLDGIAAVVNEGVVLHSELEAQTEAIRQRAAAGGLQLPPENILKEQVLERLIVEQVQMQRADRYGIVISDQMVNSALARLAQQNNIPFEQLPQILAADGIDYAEYRRNIRKQLTLEQLRQIDVINRITVAPREIEQCIASIENDVVGNTKQPVAYPDIRSAIRHGRAV